VALVAVAGVRVAILVSVVPGLLATLSIVYAIRHSGAPRMVFETGNIAATLLILRATDLLQPGRGHDRAVEIALLLYTLYNVAATLVNLPAGRAADRRSAPAVLAAGVACFLAAYVGSALAAASVAMLAVYWRYLLRPSLPL
jgi:MFS family permease